MHAINYPYIILSAIALGSALNLSCSPERGSWLAQTSRNAAHSENLLEIFLSLPSFAVAGMSDQGKLTFYNAARTWQDEPGGSVWWIDNENMLILYYVDHPLKTGAVSSFHLKIFRDQAGRPVVFSHIPRRTVNERKREKFDTFILRRDDGKWVDVTEEILPNGVDRDWYFLPSRRDQKVEAGPVVWKKREKGSEAVWEPVRTADLYWNGSVFELRESPSRKFTPLNEL
jgi:hypothetical protein